MYDDKGWDDHPARFFCGGCRYHEGGRCTSPNSDEQGEETPNYHEACVFYKEDA